MRQLELWGVGALENPPAGTPRYYRDYSDPATYPVVRQVVRARVCEIGAVRLESGLQLDRRLVVAKATRQGDVAVLDLCLRPGNGGTRRDEFCRAAQRRDSNVSQGASEPVFRR